MAWSVFFSVTLARQELTWRRTEFKEGALSSCCMLKFQKFQIFPLMRFRMLSRNLVLNQKCTEPSHHTKRHCATLTNFAKNHIFRRFLDVFFILLPNYNGQGFITSTRRQHNLLCILRITFILWFLRTTLTLLGTFVLAFRFVFLPMYILAFSPTVDGFSA